jgi:hypothetical protein
MAADFSALSSDIKAPVSLLTVDTPSILRLPNELLREILSYVLANPAFRPPLNDSYDGFRESRICDSPVLAVRAVCHTFRIIADEMPFWYNKNFKLLSLIPYTSVENEECFLDSLLTDRYLVHMLRLRTHWEFRSLGAILTIVREIPSFFENTTSISLPSFRHRQREFLESLNFPLMCFAACRGIKSLDLRDGGHATDLNMLSNLYPQLENLSMCSHAFYKGTLAGLSNIKKLRLIGKVYNFRNPPMLLPLDSATTMTTLEIYRLPSSRYLTDTTPLDAFVNLTSLHIRPLILSFCDFVCRTSAHLITFSTTVNSFSNLSSRRIISMLSARSLQSLQEFNFTVQRLMDYESIIVETVKLPFLRRLYFQMGLDLRWCRHFPRIASLDVLRWKLMEEKLIDASFQDLGINIHSLPAGAEGVDDNIKLDEKAKLVFLSEFAKINKTPRIEIDIWNLCLEDLIQV